MNVNPTHALAMVQNAPTLLDHTYVSVNSLELSWLVMSVKTLMNVLQELTTALKSVMTTHQPKVMLSSLALVAMDMTFNPIANHMKISMNAQEITNVSPSLLATTPSVHTSVYAVCVNQHMGTDGQKYNCDCEEGTMQYHL